MTSTQSGTDATPSRSRTLEQRWSLTYHHAMGETAQHFFDALKERAEILARRCPSCQRALLPPRAFCDRCFVETDGWVRCGTSGTLQAFTVVNQTFQGLPDAPYCLGYVLLEGADTAVLNYLDGVDLSDVDAAGRSLHVGTLVEVVMNEGRKGSMTDFHFRVVR